MNKYLKDHFSILILASTTVMASGLAIKGLRSISLISVANLKRLESLTIISVNICSLIPGFPRVPCMIL
jgi:hypothetical protein